VARGKGVPKNQGKDEGKKRAISEDSRRYWMCYDRQEAKYRGEALGEGYIKWKIFGQS